MEQSATTNNRVLVEGEYTTADVKLPDCELEDGLVEEIQQQVDNEAFQNPIKYMPDVHGGIGPHAIVGFSMELGDRVIPNSVGGDIGCGMTALKVVDVDVDFDDIDDLRSVNNDVRDAIPMGTGRVNDHSGVDFETLYPWKYANGSLEMLHSFLDNDQLVSRSLLDEQFDMEYVENLCDKIGATKSYVKNSLGSLGSGNHFIEISTTESDENWEHWVVVHSGSRNLGQKVCGYHQEMATEERSHEIAWDQMTDEQREYTRSDGSPDWDRIREDFSGDKIEELGAEIKSYQPDSDRNTKLDYLEGPEMYDYLKDMVFAQQYASKNRLLMAETVADIIGGSVAEVVDSPHNYIDFQDGTIRKGSTRALDNEKFVVPMNMEDGTLVCRGKGNDEWNRSAPHGAGRLGSRGWARSQFDADEVRKRMYDNGTYSSSVPVDEVPEAYKDMALIEEQIEPTAEVVDRLEPVMNFKA